LNRNISAATGVTASAEEEGLPALAAGLDGGRVKVIGPAVAAELLGDCPGTVGAAVVCDSDVRRERERLGQVAVQPGDAAAQVALFVLDRNDDLDLCGRLASWVIRREWGGQGDCRPSAGGWSVWRVVLGLGIDEVSRASHGRQNW
jgi:hypothetical protein